ncbi:sensor histidine kinase [Alteraurantiacibacter buctensis]|uniref:histidine kinase n=1 Tax=Alteraurantiacibacter buctensis TaxID=1503981 RepID=A0A844YY24_9SPHN|nr:ATP-binding protein [Alteraurantiacibacter buctensis]MXO71681.1 hypothetical protein [Alteraurantiacibacter buctensis]
MDHLLAFALIVNFATLAALGVALVAVRRGRLARAAAAPDPDPAPQPVSQAAQEAAVLEALCRDIRARTNGVVGLAELLVAAPLPEEQLRQAELIADSGRTMLRLLGDVLDVTRIDAGGLQLEAEPTDLRELLGHSVGLMQASARARGLTLVLVVDDGVPALIELDRARLRQVVLNLVGNAIKFTESGRIDVQARLAQTDSGPQLAISVIDTGPGIARERQADIFQPFFRQASTAAPAMPASGTGLGLALTSRIVRAMGGEIALESAPGLGSCFTVRLPMAASEHAEADAPATRPSDPHQQREMRSHYLLRRQALLSGLREIALSPGLHPHDANWDNLASQLHRLADIAATFGDARLGDVARRLHGELRQQPSPRLRHEVLLRHWDELQAASTT